MLAAVQDFLEMLFSYKQSVYYRIHFVGIILCGLLLFYILKEERRLKKTEEERPLSKCSNKVPYFDYVTNKQKTTREAVQKLEQSKEYQQFLADRNNPSSRYHRQREEEEVSQIELSDDSSLEEDRKRK